VVAVVATVSAGCAGHTSPGGQSNPTDPPTSLGPPVTLRLGFVGATSGTGAALSRAVEYGERLAVSQFTSDNAGIDVLVDARSTRGTPAGAAAAARRLVRDGVVAVIGPQSPAEVGGALPVLSAAGIPAVTATATATALAGSGWTSFFRVVADDGQQGVDEGGELVSSLHLSSLAVLSEGSSSDRDRSAAAASEAALLGATVSIDRAVTTPAGATDVAARIVESGIDGTYFSGIGPVALDLVTDLTDDGYQGRILIATDAPSSVLDPLGTTADGVYLASAVGSPAATAAQSSRALAFYDAYRAAFGSRPPVWAAQGYDAAEAVLAAVTGGARSGRDVSSYLFTHTSSGVSAPVAFAGDGNQINPPVYVSEIRAGTPVQVAITTQPVG
jgi:branched-chain amino acid transport system substrate-binding protein